MNCILRVREQAVYAVLLLSLKLIPCLENVHDITFQFAVY